MKELTRNPKIDRELELILTGIAGNINPLHGGSFHQEDIGVLGSDGRALLERTSRTYPILGEYEKNFPIVSLIVPSLHPERGFCRVTESKHYDAVLDGIRAYEADGGHIILM